MYSIRLALHRLTVKFLKTFVALSGGETGCAKRGAIASLEQQSQRHFRQQLVAVDSQDYNVDRCFCYYHLTSKGTVK